jgi:23S rRNA (cytosine1962-C5)-methyltransferase
MAAKKRTMNDIAQVSRRGARRWDAGHPWIYRSDVTRPPSVAAGAVHVVDERGEFLGTALWSPTSQISLRLLAHDDQPIDDVFWRERIGAAIGFRDSLHIDGNAYRVLHGEADGTPSLVVDKYDDVLVAQFLSAGIETYREEIVAVLADMLQPAGILARNDPPVRLHEQLPLTTELLQGAVPEEIEVREGGIRYLAAPWHGQKTGAFLDQRENRARCGQLARGRTMDCFAFHGSFALHLAANSEQVTAIDSSGDALARARVNAELNGFSNVDFVEANAFDYLRAQEEAGEEYDVVVVDPPAFAKRRDAVDKALRGYKEINLRAMRLLKPGGHLCSFSCSFHISTALFREMLEAAAADAGRPLRWIEARGQAADHPEILQIPESIYLKGAILQAVE